MRGRGARLVLVLMVASLAAGCGTGRATPGSADGRVAGAQRARAGLALQDLAARTCPDRPQRTTLTGLPSLRLACLGTGPSRAVSAGDGRPTVVNLWASWCPPCVREMPMLQRTSERAGTGVAFVGIDTEDEPASAADLMAATGVRYPSYQDPQARVRKSLRALGLPVTIVYDAGGREVARRLGAIRGNWLDEALRKAGVALASSAGG